MGYLDDYKELMGEFLGELDKVPVEPKDKQLFLTDFIIIN